MKDAYGLEEIDPADTGPELTRHFRGMRMWLPLHLHGLAPFKANLEEKLLLCRYFHEQIGKMGFETGSYPDLSVAIFRIADDPDNDLNEQLIKALHEDGRVFFSSTVISGKRWIRCAVVSFRTHLNEIKLALSMIKEISDALSKKVKRSN
jgi:glutamate/tyrosine decarboxylase-like PLP-dependent enzyme